MIPSRQSPPTNDPPRRVNSLRLLLPSLFAGLGTAQGNAQRPPAGACLATKVVTALLFSSSDAILRPWALLLLLTLQETTELDKSAVQQFIMSESNGSLASPEFLDKKTWGTKV